MIEHGLKIELTAEAREFLIEKGTSADFGARPLRRAIEQHVEDPLAEEILRGSFKGKDLIKISVKGEDERASTCTSSPSAPPPPGRSQATGQGVIRRNLRYA